MLRALLLLAVIVPARADAGRPAGVPPSADILEMQRLPRAARENRALAIWMETPEHYPRSPSEPYSCPELTRGSYKSGRTHISLIDVSAKRVINTVRVVTGDMHHA